MRKLVVQALERDGYDVRSVGDGAGFLAQVSEQLTGAEGSVDLIISDVRMPVVDGLAVVQKLRRARCTVPIILMTAFGDDETRRHAEAAGAMMFDKPFAMVNLRAAVMYLAPRV